MPRFQIYACIVAVFLVSWAGAIGLMPRIDPKLRIVEDFSSIPMNVGNWVGAEQEMTPEDIAQTKMTLEILSTCSVLSRNYQDNWGNVVQFSVVCGRDLGDFHQPEICLRGEGWNRISGETITLNPKGLTSHQATIVKLSNENSMSEMVMVYWFYMSGDRTPAMSKANAIYNAMTGKGLQPSAMVKCATIITSDEESARKAAIELAELLEPSVIDLMKKKPTYEPSNDIFKRLGDVEDH